jgi:hypothetical protein
MRNDTTGLCDCAGRCSGPINRACGVRLNRLETSEISLCGCLGMPRWDVRALAKSAGGAGQSLSRIAIDSRSKGIGVCNTIGCRTARRGCGRGGGAAQHRSRSRGCVCRSPAIENAVTAGRLSNGRPSIGCASVRGGVASGTIGGTITARRFGSRVRFAPLASAVANALPPNPSSGAPLPPVALALRL